MIEAIENSLALSFRASFFILRDLLAGMYNQRLKILAKGLRPLKSPRAQHMAVEFETVFRARGFEKSGARSQKKNPESPLIMN
jgi:hypothetical protein